MLSSVALQSFDRSGQHLLLNLAVAQGLQSAHPEQAHGFEQRTWGMAANPTISGNFQYQYKRNFNSINGVTNITQVTRTFYVQRFVQLAKFLHWYCLGIEFRCLGLIISLNSVAWVQ